MAIITNYKRRALWAAGLCTLFVAAGTAGYADTLDIPPPQPKTVSAPKVSSSDLLAQITMLQQLASVRLTAAQMKGISTQLAQLETSGIAYTKLEERAAGRVRPQLERMNAAILAGRAPANADRTAVNAGLAVLQTEGGRLAQLRNNTLVALRQDMTRAQIDVVRYNIGIAPVGQDASALYGGAIGPVAGYYLPGDGYGGGYGESPERILWLLDQAQGMPLLTFDQYRDDIIDELATASGGNPSSPDFAIQRERVRDLLGRVRGLNYLDYQGVRQQVATDIAGQAYMAQYAAALAAQQASAAIVASDMDALGSFFLRPGMVRVLKLALSHMAVTTPAGK